MSQRIPYQIVQSFTFSFFVYGKLFRISRFLFFLRQTLFQKQRIFLTFQSQPLTSSPLSPPRQTLTENQKSFCFRRCRTFRD